MKLFLKIFVPVFFICVGLGGAYYLMAFKPKPEITAYVPKTPPVTVQPAELQSVSIPVYSRGGVTPGTEIQLAVEVAGTVQSVSPKLADGAFFKKNDILLVIDDSRYQFELTQAKSQYTAAQEGYNRLRDELNIEADPENLPPDIQVPKTRIKRQLKEAAARLAAAKAAVEIARMQIDKTKLRAPFDGRVLRSEIGRGQIVGPGRPVAQVYAVDVAEVRLPLSDRQVGLVDVPQLYEDDVTTKDGPEVTLQMTYGGDQFYWQGKIVRSEGGIDPLNRLLYIVAKVENPYARDPEQEGRPPLAAGRFLEAQIQGKMHENIVVLPRKVLRYGNEVWVVDEEERLHKRNVTVRHKGKDLVYISEGLQQGELVVLTPLDVAVEGMKVRSSLFDELDRAGDSTKIVGNLDENTFEIDATPVAEDAIETITAAVSSIETVEPEVVEKVQQVIEESVSVNDQEKIAKKIQQLREEADRIELPKEVSSLVENVGDDAMARLNQLAAAHKQQQESTAESEQPDPAVAEAEKVKVNAQPPTAAVKELSVEEPVKPELSEAEVAQVAPVEESPAVEEVAKAEAEEVEAEAEAATEVAQADKPESESKESNNNSKANGAGAGKVFLSKAPHPGLLQESAQ